LNVKAEEQPLERKRINTASDSKRRMLTHHGPRLRTGMWGWAGNPHPREQAQLGFAIMFVYRIDQSIG
jgi:hypothetical protein